MRSETKGGWSPHQCLGLSSVGILYVVLGISWFLIPPRPELHGYFTTIRPWLWIFVGLGTVITSNTKKLPFIFLNLMGALAFERIFVLTIDSFLENNLSWYSAIWYIGLWLAACYAYLLPYKRVMG